MMNSNDQDPMTMPEETNSPSRSYTMSSTIMLSAIIVLFFVVVLMVFLHLYARWYLLRARRRHLLRRRNRRATIVFFSDDPPTVTASRGLDPTVIKSLPVFTFFDTTHKDPIECAVCLSEFEESESGRVLPSCKHTFHVDCIDMWFHSHSTCPLCRSLVEPSAEEQEVVITVSPEPVSAIEPGSSSGLRKPAAIEVPRRNISEFENELTRNSPASHSFRSPMSRMLSFTRMLSRDRRNGSSPVSGGPPLSPSLSCQIPVAEEDIERGGEETM